MMIYLFGAFNFTQGKFLRLHHTHDNLDKNSDKNWNKSTSKTWIKNMNKNE